MVAASADDAHRPLEKHHDLAAILSHVETRQVHQNYTIQWDATLYRIAPQDISAGLRAAVVRTEKRRDGSRVVRFQDRYLGISECERRPQVMSVKAAKPRLRTKPAQAGQWNKNFYLRKAPKIWQARKAPAPSPRGRSDGPAKAKRKAGQKQPGSFAFSLAKVSARKPNTHPLPALSKPDISTLC